MPKHYAMHGVGIFQGNYNTDILPRVHGQNAIWKAFDTREKAEKFMAFENPYDARAHGLRQSRQRNNRANAVGPTTAPIQRQPAQQRARAQDFFESPPSTPPTQLTPTQVVNSDALSDEAKDHPDGHAQDSPDDQVPHVNRASCDGAFAVQQIREINSAMSHVDAVIAQLRVEDKPVLVGPALVEKANLQSQLIQARFLRLALGSADTDALVSSCQQRQRQQQDEVWPLVQEALTVHRREIARLKSEDRTRAASILQEQRQL